MFDTSENYSDGKSEEEMWVPILLYIGFVTRLAAMLTYIFRGRIIKELGLRRTDLVISTKIFWGSRKGHNDSGLSRKQYVGTNFGISISA